ncbi:2'-5' RNA ligase family protein [Microbacterium sp. cf332]|uniref:2'-5' RNA ligase family protein n=1 Tax=Microbacterium sp. cf332 TaxID=1761804 RepID=UPI0008802E0B|nr:2'-5' RNA ligase family protein [Microbacterium sp. cf332]SDQ24385.1 2'-5' RNA ligase [Microbacterium sp. cf332]
MFSVEMIPDGRVDAAVRGDWQRLVDAGLPSAGRHPSESNRPHVTVAVRDELSADAASALAPIAAAMPLVCRLGGLVLFPARDRFVLARPLVVTAELLRFHADVVELVGEPPEHYAVTAPDRWTPHITLARRMTPAQVGQALELLEPEPVEGELAGLRLWDSEEKVVTPLR